MHLRLGSLSVLSLIWSTASCLQMPASVKSYDLICIGTDVVGQTKLVRGDACNAL